MLSRSTVTGVTPAPSAALRLRSSTEVLFPSQWSCMPSPRRLPPDRRIVRGAIEFSIANVRRVHGEVKLDCLVGIESVNPPGPPIQLPIEKGETLTHVQKTVAHPVDDDQPVERLLEEVQIAAERLALDCAQQVVGAKSTVNRHLAEELV